MPSIRNTLPDDRTQAIHRRIFRLHSGSPVRLVVRKLRRVRAVNVGTLTARLYTGLEQER